MNTPIALALEAVSACKVIVEDYSRRLDEACVEYYESGKKLFPKLSRAEDEGAEIACQRALKLASAIIPDAQAQWDSIKYPSSEYPEMVERARALWVRRRNLLRMLEKTLEVRSRAPQPTFSALGGNAMPDAKSARTIIVHGHDERNLLALKDILASRLKLPEPMIMAQQMVPGASLPEKFEQLACRVDFAVALLTPDDVGRSVGSSDLLPRPRQNTLVEIGWFWGRLGRERVLLLVKKELELPSDLQGVEYHRFESKVEEVIEKIRDFFAVYNHG